MATNRSGAGRRDGPEIAASNGSGRTPGGGTPNRDGETPKKEGESWQDVFIRALTASGIVRVACKVAEVGRATAYRHRESNEAFAAAWDDALDDACDSLEAEARRRATQGTHKPVFYKGKIVGHIKEYSDTLIIFLLKANRPEKYRDNFDLRKVLEALPQSTARTPADD